MGAPRSASKAAASHAARPTRAAGARSGRTKILPALIGAVMAVALAAPAAARQVPRIPEEVARPGGDLPGDPKIALVKVADGFNDPVNATNTGDGSGRIFVVERGGRVRVVDKDGNVQQEPFLDLTRLNPLGSDVQAGFLEQGLYSITFHPNFEENGHFYVHFASLRLNGDGLIARFTVDPASPNIVTPERAIATAKEIMRIEQPWYNHNGGEIAFGPDGYLYIGSGDGGYIEGGPGPDSFGFGQSLSTPLGKLLRIDVDTDAGPYRVPDDNPFAHDDAALPRVLFGVTKEELGAAGAPPEVRWLGVAVSLAVDTGVDPAEAAADPRAPIEGWRRMVLFGADAEEFLGALRPKPIPEIWAYGLRNPYQFAFDPGTGDLFITDVGQDHWEEINWQPARGGGGENYGWSKMEGSHCHPLTGGPGDRGCPVVGVLPVAEYPHRIPYPGAVPLDDDWGCSALGLGVANYGGMEGVYLVGDWCSGRIFGVGWNDEAGEWAIEELVQTDLQFTGGGYDEDGQVLAVNCECSYRADQGPMANPPGALWRVVPAGEVPAGAEVARTIR